MNGFYGIFNADGTDIDNEIFDAIGLGLNVRGFNTGKACRRLNFHANHYSKSTFQERSISFGPCKTDDGRLLLAGYFRLDYREELGDKLGLKQEELLNTTDASLVLKAYDKWKLDCILHLEGDWAFVLFDGERQSLLMAKDPSGCSALFYRFEGNHLFFSSDSTALMDLGEFTDTVDPIQLLRVSVPFVGMDAGKTLVGKLFYLCGAHAMKFENAVWSMPYRYIELAGRPINHYRFDDDVAFAHFSCFQLSVMERIRFSQSVGVMLSSGMDSTAVASLSSLALEKTGSRMKTYTSFPHHQDALSDAEKSYADESGIVKQFASRRQNIDANFGDFADFRLSQCDAKCHVHGPFMPILHLNHFWINGLFEKAKEQGVGLMMTGQTGNFTISGDGYFVHADLFRKLSIKALYLELQAISKRTGKSMWATFRNRVLLVLLFQIKSYNRFHKLFSKSYWRKFRYLNPEFVSAVSSKIHKSKNEFTGGHYWVRSGQSLRRAQIELYLTNVGMLWYDYGIEKNMHVSDPTADIRLINHSFEIGDEWFYHKGTPKWIYRKMMKGIVDQEVLQNKMGKVQSHDFGLRMKYDSNLKDRLGLFKQTEGLAEYFDLFSLNELLEEIVENPTPQMKKTKIFHFLQCFSIINYLFSKKDLILNLKSQSNVR